MLSTRFDISASRMGSSVSWPNIILHCDGFFKGTSFVLLLVAALRLSPQVYPSRVQGLQLPQSIRRKNEYQLLLCGREISLTLPYHNAPSFSRVLRVPTHYNRIRHTVCKRLCSWTHKRDCTARTTFSCYTHRTAPLRRDMQ